MPDENAPETPSQPQTPAETAAAPCSPLISPLPHFSTCRRLRCEGTGNNSRSNCEGASHLRLPQPPLRQPLPRRQQPPLRRARSAPPSPKVKPKKATQRACDEKDAKGKLCRATWSAGTITRKRSKRSSAKSGNLSLRILPNYLQTRSLADAAQLHASLLMSQPRKMKNELYPRLEYLRRRRNPLRPPRHAQ